jgi:hypothetical protein
MNNYLLALLLVLAVIGTISAWKLKFILTGILWVIPMLLWLILSLIGLVRNPTYLELIPLGILFMAGMLALIITTIIYNLEKRNNISPT